MVAIWPGAQSDKEVAYLSKSIRKPHISKDRRFHRIQLTTAIVTYRCTALSADEYRRIVPPNSRRMIS